MLKKKTHKEKETTKKELHKINIHISNEHNNGVNTFLIIAYHLHIYIGFIQLQYTIYS